MKKMMMIGMAFLSLAGCKTLEDAINQTIGANLPTTGGSSGGISLPTTPDAENCGSASSVLRAYKAAAKENELTANEKFQGKWCRFSGTVSRVTTYIYGIGSHPSVVVNKNIYCITTHPDHLGNVTSSTPNPPEVERSRNMLKDLRTGQKITVVGQVSMRTWHSNTSMSNTNLPVANCRIVEPQ
ncbi:MAG: OB-fold putative lipoprotein [Zoogloeaceae bacterium]|jgi:hypothetical protein|nr:OB-fold putative lipoprotein [Zoogloeaceae bacterium]